MKALICVESACLNLNNGLRIDNDVVFLVRHLVPSDV